MGRTIHEVLILNEEMHWKAPFQQMKKKRQYSFCAYVRIYLIYNRRMIIEIKCRIL